MPGKGKMTITGKLGDVMQELVQAARSYVRSRSPSSASSRRLFDKLDIHVHVPEGATPEGRPLGRRCHGHLDRLGADQDSRSRHVAMTGEITLRGRVLPIGGLKEKLLAALRGGIKTVLIPKDNEKDLAEIPDNVKKGAR